MQSYILWSLFAILVAYNLKLYFDSQKKYDVVITDDEILISNMGKAIGNNGLEISCTQFSDYVNATKIEAFYQLNGISNIQPLLLTLIRFKKLKHLNLQVGNNPIGNHTAPNFQALLTQLPALETLKLGIDGLFTHEGRQLVIQAIASMPRLTTLSLSLINTDLSGNKIEPLLQLTKLTHLKSIELILMGCNLTASSTKTLQTLLFKLPKLESLNLNLYGNNIMVDGTDDLSAGLFHQKQVSTLELELYLNNITTNGTESVMAVVGQMVNLTKLHIGLQFNYIGDKGGVLVAKAIEDKKHITDLSVNVASKNFAWIGYEAILKAIEKLPPLTTLDLKIGVNKCGPKGADILKKVLFKHDKLKSLSLDYYENYIGNAGATLLSEGILAQKQLDNLVVNMAFNEITDRGAIEITKAIEKAKSPKHIDFRLSQNKITDKGSREILQIISSILPRVEQFDFEFLGTALTNATRDDILSDYGHFQNLEFRVNTIPPESWD